MLILLTLFNSCILLFIFSQLVPDRIYSSGVPTASILQLIDTCLNLLHISTMSKFLYFIVVALVLFPVLRIDQWFSPGKVHPV